jgi:hypothetical protein
LPPLRLPHEQHLQADSDLLQDTDMLLDVCDGLGFAADDPWRQLMQMRQRQQSYTSGVARTGSSSGRQAAADKDDGADGEQSLVDVAAVAGEAARQDSLLHPVGSDTLQVWLREGCQACNCQQWLGLSSGHRSWCDADSSAPSTAGC